MNPRKKKLEGASGRHALTYSYSAHEKPIVLGAVRCGRRDANADARLDLAHHLHHVARDRGDEEDEER